MLTQRRMAILMLKRTQEFNVAAYLTLKSYAFLEDANRFIPKYARTSSEEVIAKRWRRRQRRHGGQDGEEVAAKTWRPRRRKGGGQDMAPKTRRR